MIVVIGAHGMLGRDLMTLLGDRAVGLDLPAIDITDLFSVQEALAPLAPSVVINCAAFTNVDACEQEVDRALQVNAEGVAYLAMVTAGLKAKLVHISTDYVFDGQKQTPYLPDDLQRPINIYGESKLAGELNTDINPDNLVIRTQWLYGHYGSNFVETIIRVAKERGTVAVVDDQFGTPTWTVDLCQGIMALVDAGQRGVFHCVNGGSTSWYGFAEEILRQTAIPCTLSSQSSADLQRPARRPAHAVLDTSSLTEATGYTPPPWQESLERYLAMRADRKECCHG